MRFLAGVTSALLLAMAACAPPGGPQTAVYSVEGASAAATAFERDYLVYAASEATDRIALIRFGPAGARVEKEITVGMMPADADGPHGIAVSPDGRFWYTTTAHGAPFGYLWKYATGSDSLIGRVMLGNFPATMQLTPDGAFVYAVNFNLHGEMVPSSVSVVAADEMLEVARVQTCTMPHGSRINAQGTRQYSACMMDDAVVEIDTRTFAVARHFMLRQGAEHGMTGAPRARGAAGHDAGGHGMEPPKPGDVGCSPTWAQPSADGGRLFVACNKSSDIVEIDVARWAMTRRIAAGAGVYNLAVTRDGAKLIGTNKRGQSVSVIDIASGRELARLQTKRRVVHGVVVSPDDRYAFVSVEGVGSEPGTVEVIDLVALKTVATVDIGQMAGGIDFWRMEPSR
ncbi:MAG TPA: YncE family protein [Gemmatimonadaceae bacterium]|nr:YncE family protein [Gemmatimonadaceae bacterium]